MSRYPPKAPSGYDCPYWRACPHLEGLSTRWVFEEYQKMPLRENDLRNDLEALDAENREYRRQIKALEAEKAVLAAKLALVHRRQFKANRIAAVAPPGRQPGKKKRGVPVGHKGWHRAEPDHVDETVSVPPPATCPRCGSTELDPVATEREHVQEDIVLPVRPHVKRFVHGQAYCRHCRRTVVQSVAGELTGAPIGPVTKSISTYLRRDVGMTCRKTQRVLHDLFGMTFVPASAMQFDRRAAARGAPLYEDLKEKVRSSEVVHADETSWRQDGVNHFAWFAGTEDVAVFRIDRHRSTEAAHQLLGTELPGTLVTDAYAVYDKVAAEHRQSCLAHLIRRAAELAAELAARPSQHCRRQMIGFCERIADFFRAVCAEAKDTPAGPRHKAARERRAHELEGELLRLCEQPFADPDIESFRRRLTSDEHHNYFTCIVDPAVPPTNNLAERALRPLVIFRKLSFGTRSEHGSQTLGILASLMATAHLQDVHPLSFLQTLLTSSIADAHRALFNNSS